MKQGGRRRELASDALIMVGAAAVGVGLWLTLPVLVLVWLGLLVMLIGWAAGR